MSLLLDDVSDAVPVTRRMSPIILADYHRGQIPANAGRRFPPEPLTRDECERLLAALPRRGPSGLRNRALVAVMWRAGLRVSEATALYPKDVDEANGIVRVLHGKGDKFRSAGIDAGALAVLRVWLDARRELGIGPRARLFCTISVDCIGRPLNTAYVRGFVKHYARKAGIDKRVTPHTFRHTHAFELCMEGVPLNVIQAQLGHSNIAVTSRYLAHIAPNELVRTIGRREWGNGDT